MTFLVKKKADKPCPRCYAPMVEQADKTYACSKHGATAPAQAAPQNGRALLDQMDAGEPVTAANGSAHENSAGDEPGGSTSGTPAPETSGDTAAAASPAPAEPKTTRASRYGTTIEERQAQAVTDIQALAARLGRPPVARDDFALRGRARTAFGTWADAVVAAGYERPQRGGYAAKPLSAQKPQPAPAVSIDADTGPARPRAGRPRRRTDLPPRPRPLPPRTHPPPEGDPA